MKIDRLSDTKGWWAVFPVTNAERSVHLFLFGHPYIGVPRRFNCRCELKCGTWPDPY